MVDIGGCWSLTLADVYTSMSKENVCQFLVSPYTAQLPGAEYSQRFHAARILKVPLYLNVRM